MGGAGWEPAGAEGSGPAAVEGVGGAEWGLWAKGASVVGGAGTVRWEVEEGAVQEVLIGAQMLRQM